MVKRYDHTVGYFGNGDYRSEMEEHEYGDYVDYDDYRELEDEKIDLEMKLERLEQKAKELYMEF